MANAKTTLALPQVNAVAGSDRVLIIYNAANTAIAQTASITVNNYDLYQVQSDPANSTSMVVPAGTLFFSANFLYFADANNHVKRVALSSF
ncbi:MAG TPA: hypothetical protein VEP90_13070 [Methylomirabilota bacterium]|nr:hypothetical protein [Methylomirabilota bacterium]